MRWLLSNARARLAFAAKNPAYSLRSLLREITLADERFISKLTGTAPRKIRSFLEEPLGTPEFARCLRDAEAVSKAAAKVSADLYAKKVLVQYAAIRALSPELVVETGVANGVSSAYLLLAMHKNGRGRLHSIEVGDTTYLPPGKSPGWMVPDKLKDRWSVHIGDARNLLPKLLGELKSIDVFIHDSLHTYDHMLWEYRVSYPYIRPGGLLFSDDVSWNSAFPEFVREVSPTNAAILRGVGFLQKSGSEVPVDSLK